MIAITQHLSEIAPHYDVLLCDVWGVVHNGVAPYPQACDALKRTRDGGATVILITNSPRPSEQVARQMERLTVPPGTYDAIVSSGDVTRAEIRARPGKSFFHLGPERDSSIFSAVEQRFAPLDEADYVICTGLLNDEVETPDDYRAQLEAMLKRKLLMVCGNPDVVVERGDKMIYCAGAIADLYRTMGGDVIYAGKPYRSIYDLALAQAEKARAKKTPPNRVLAIGDSIRTDLTGAHAVGADFLFVTSGIHAEQFGGRERPDTKALEAAFAEAGAQPKAVMRQLVW